LACELLSHGQRPAKGDNSDHDAFNERILRSFAFPNLTTWGTLQRIISKQDRNGAGNG
jgi:hypothetical protein